MRRTPQVISFSISFHSYNLPPISSQPQSSFRTTTMKSYSLIPFLSAFISPALSTPTSSSYPTHGTDATYAHPANGICTDYLAKETVTWRKAIWDLPKFKDNFDIVAFQTAMGSLEASEVFHPISRYEDNVTSTYTLSGTFCKPKKMKGEKERTVLLATHGGGYDRR